MFSVNREEFEQEQLAREQKLEDTITKKQQKVDQVFIMDSIVDSGLDERVVAQYNTHAELVNARKIVRLQRFMHRNSCKVY